MAVKCGNCQRNSMRKSTQAPKERLPLAAAQPISGGMAPGTAPTSVQNGGLLFSGVYSAREDHTVRIASTHANVLAVQARGVAAAAESRSPKVGAARAVSLPAG